MTLKRLKTISYTIAYTTGIAGVCFVPLNPAMGFVGILLGIVIIQNTELGAIKTILEDKGIM